VITSAQVGGNLSEIMDTISSTIKDRIKIRDDIRILSAQGRISGLVVGLIPVVMALLLMLINPEFMKNFFESFIGKVMIGIGVVLETIGFVIIRKIVDIEY
jgi:tight adherence protein B